jgi:predicted peptidase
MRSYVYFIGILICCSIFCVAQPSAVFEKKMYLQQQDTLLYRILYPQHYDSTTRYPLVIFLHGSGARGNDNEAPLKNVPGVFLDTHNRDIFPCFIVVPQCPKRDTWVNFPDFPQSLKATDTPTTATRLVLAFITDLSSSINIDTRRIYLTGYSMGGEGVFDLIYRKPELFAAAVPICAVADTAKAAFIKGNSIWVFHGSDDQVNEVKYSRMMINALRRQGGNPLYTEYPGVGHSCWVKAYQEPDLLPWMFSHIKPDQQKKTNRK